MLLLRSSCSQPLLLLTHHPSLNANYPLRLSHLAHALTHPPNTHATQDQQQLFAAMRAQGIPLRYTHCQVRLSSVY